MQIWFKASFLATHISIRILFWTVFAAKRNVLYETYLNRMRKLVVTGSLLRPRNMLESKRKSYHMLQCDISCRIPLIHSFVIMIIIFPTIQRIAFSCWKFYLQPRYKMTIVKHLIWAQNAHRWTSIVGRPRGWAVDNLLWIQSLIYKCFSLEAPEIGILFTSGVASDNSFVDMVIIFLDPCVP